MAIPSISLLTCLYWELTVNSKWTAILQQARWGGDSIAKFETLIVTTSLMLGYKFLRNSYPIMQAFVTEVSTEKRLDCWQDQPE
jgi:hypothetical protein